jgi:hypothetical protein
MMLDAALPQGQRVAQGATAGKANTLWHRLPIDPPRHLDLGSTQICIEMDPSVEAHQRLVVVIPVTAGLLPVRTQYNPRTVLLNLALMAWINRVITF